MKKLISVTLLAMMLLALTACGAADTAIGTGMYIAPSAANAGEKAGKAQVDVTVCTVELDGDKIVSVTWDTVQCKAAVTAKGEVTIPETFTSKKDLKDNYGMKGASAIGREWYEQLAALEEYAVGKTVADITGMALTDKGAAAVEELTSSCTVAMAPYQQALAAAAAKAQ